ncbi:hypothetical protein IAQ61_000397 [Plenodomus lingam]|uniref:uncharacterized protein n=1 Tax=Leptosphaeria maculans TaxID=5022 RepID=UPI003325F32B|nr:hypothetical protein IAQ61_000397 [Plenodomus lingam]
MKCYGLGQIENGVGITFAPASNGQEAGNVTSTEDSPVRNANMEPDQIQSRGASAAFHRHRSVVVCVCSSQFKPRNLAMRHYLW